MIDCGVSVRGSLKMRGIAVALCVLALAWPMAKRADAQFVVAEREPASPEAAAAAYLDRLALIELRGQVSPTLDDFYIAHGTFEAAAALLPGDVYAARRLGEAAWATGDPALVRSATRGLVRVDRDDEVAQLRLIADRLAGAQTVDDRLGLYERFLGEAGASLGPAIRSRLALDAALLARETGNVDRFVDWLQRSMSLDPANKDAAALGTAYYADQVGDPLRTLRFKLAVMYADPLDPNVRFAIARLLAAEGALGQAVRFHTSGLALLRQAGEMSPLQDVERLALVWQLRGPAEVIAVIRSRLEQLRTSAERQYQRDLESDVPPEQLVPPETVHLDPLYEKMRVLAGLAAADFIAAEEGLIELGMIAQRAGETLDEMARSGADVDESERARAFAAIADLQLMRGIANVELDSFERIVTEFRTADPIWQEAIRPLRLWLLFRRGDAEGALRGADLIGGEGPVVDILRGLASEDIGDIDQAAAVYARMVREQPLGSTAAWARSRRMGLLDMTDPRSEAGVAMDRLATQQPEWIDGIVDGPTRFMAMRVDPGENATPVGASRRLDLSLKNIGAVPLGVGSGQPINSRLLVAVTVNGAKGFRGTVEPEVYELRDRFALGPQEELRVSLPAEAGFNHLLYQVNADRLLRETWQVVQGYRVSSYGGLVAGPLCLTRVTEPVLRGPVVEAGLPVGDLAVLFGDAGTDRLVTLGYAAGSVLFRAGQAEADAATVTESGDGADSAEATVGADDMTPGVDALVDAVTEAFGRADDLGKAVLLGALPSGGQFSGMAEFDEAAAAWAAGRLRSGSAEDQGWSPPERAALVLALLTRVNDPGHDALRLAMNDSDESLARLAGFHAVRLSSGARAFATAGPGYEALAGAGRPVADDDGP